MKWMILLGKEDNGFSVDLGKTKQQQLFQELRKTKYNKMFHDKAKHFVYEDTKYIITGSGKHLCQKHKVHEFGISKDRMVCRYTPVNVNITNFPGTTTYHNMYVVERTVLVYDNYQVIFRTVNHQDGVTFEIRLDGPHLDTLNQVVSDLGFTTDTGDMIPIDHGAHYVLSVL